MDNGTTITIVGDHNLEGSMKIFKIAKSIRLYRGESQYNKGGHYWTTDKEWARQFTQSGRPSEVRSMTFPVEMIFRNDPLPFATNATELDTTEQLALEKGFNAFWVNEGSGQPESVYIIQQK